MKRIRTISIAAALVAICVATALPALAQAASYTTSGFICTTSSYTGRTVQAVPPFPMTNWSGTSTIENVYWSADLYKWDGTAWQLYDASKPWLQGEANQWDVIPINGYKWYVGNQAYRVLQFSGLPYGYYAVKEFLRWQNGYQLSNWQLVQGTSSYYCSF